MKLKGKIITGEQVEEREKEKVQDGKRPLAQKLLNQKIMQVMFQIKKNKKKYDKIAPYSNTVTHTSIRTLTSGYERNILFKSVLGGTKKQLRSVPERLWKLADRNFQEYIEVCYIRERACYITRSSCCRVK